MGLMNLPVIAESYVEAFQRCYPQKNVQVVPRHVSAWEIRYRVYVDGEPGDSLLTEDDLRFATALFNRGYGTA